MQSRLMDVNTAAVRYRNETLSSLMTGRYDSCIGSLETINGLLPEEFRIKVSTQQYNKLISEKVGKYIVCSLCLHESKFNDIRIYDHLLSLEAQIVLKTRYIKMWKCKCGFVNQLSKTPLIDNILESPHYLKIVPDPPQYQPGLYSRINWVNEFIKWYWNFVHELENAIALYREQYKNEDEAVYLKLEKNLASLSVEDLR